MSGLEILGAVASAAQLADLCFKVLKSISCLYRDIKAIPRDIDNSITRISQLSEVAQLVSNTPSLHSPVITAVVHEALADIEALLSVLEETSHAKSSHFIKQQWHNVSHILQEPVVRKLLDRLESTKVTLSLCIDTVNSQALHSIGIEVRHIRDGSDQLSRGLPMIHDNVLKTLTTVQDLPKIAARLHILTTSHDSIAEKITDIHRLLPDLRKFDAMLDPVGTMAVSLGKPFSRMRTDILPEQRYTEHKITTCFCAREGDRLKATAVCACRPEPPIHRPPIDYLPDSRVL
jgi:hypothetical protein